MIELGHISHSGKKRTLNEDSYHIDVINRFALIVDGMGGANAGDIASAFVREQLRNNLLQGENPETALINAGQALRIQRPQQGQIPSGASAIVLTWQNQDYQLAWVGACRAYFFNGSQTELQCEISQSKTKKEAPVNNTSIQALGVTAPDKLQVHQVNGSWKAPQAVLLCTDGIVEECELPLIQGVMSNYQMSAQEAVEQLLFHVLQGPANNNATALLLRQS
jgi:serine/threonine protein phosphatase PrpC